MIDESTRRNIRLSVSQLLDLYASREDLLRVATHWPFTELFEMWDDFFPGRPLRPSDAFSPSENEALRTFTELADKTWNAIHGRSERIEDFVASPEWPAFADAARKTRASLQE